MEFSGDWDQVCQSYLLLNLTELPTGQVDGTLLQLSTVARFPIVVGVGQIPEGWWITFSSPDSSSCGRPLGVR
jgi:hypothetical protein